MLRLLRLLKMDLNVWFMILKVTLIWIYIISNVIFKEFKIVIKELTFFIHLFYCSSKEKSKNIEKTSQKCKEFTQIWRKTGRKIDFKMGKNGTSITNNITTKQENDSRISKTGSRGHRKTITGKLKSIFYKSKLENPSAPKRSHICALDARKYAAHLRKFWRQLDFLNLHL